MSHEPTIEDVLDTPVWSEGNLRIILDDGHVGVYDKEDGEAVLIPFEVLKRINRKVNDHNRPDTTTGIPF